MSGMLFTSYDDDGRIISTGRAINHEEQVSNVGGVFIGAIFDGDVFYFLNDNPVMRPDAPEISLSALNVEADSESTIDLIGVPAGSKISFGGAEYMADGEVIHLSTNMVGPNKVYVDPFPARTWEGVFYGVAS